MEPVDSRHDRHRNIPRIAKIIILTQAAIILGFTVGMYEEYLNNPYFQQYVVAIFTSTIMAEATLSMVTASLFALGTFTLLGSMSSKRKNSEWEILSKTTDLELDSHAVPVLQIVPQPKSTTRKPRQRKRRPNNNDIFRAMTRPSEPTTD